MRVGRLLHVLGCWLVFCSVVQAGPVDVDRARVVAADFLGMPGTGVRGGAGLPLLLSSCGGEAGGLRGGGLVDYYVFGLDADSDRGFIVVSGDDAAQPVLGYSLDSRFDASALPEGLRYWLGVCGGYVSQARRRAGVHIARHRSAEPIAPLLAGMVWNQSAPYNKYTPRMDGVATPVGCVATALAQVMRYHCWPGRGRGEVSYRLRSGENIKERLGVHAYDWGGMISSYGGDETPAQQDAVARLMYEVGVASQMQYSTKGSGAHSYRAAQALRSNFRYSPTVRFSPRWMMAQGEWESMILAELRANRPVYYAGASVGGGHAFVCDGYDGRGYFHFNWGWGGLGNGYFSLLDLDPVVQGIGAGSGSGYLIQQEVITGIQPDTVRNARAPLSICVDTLYVKPGERAKSEKLTVLVTRFMSFSVGRVKVEPGVGVYSEDGRLVQAFGLGEVADLLQPFYYIPSFEQSVSVSSLPDGSYRLRPIVREKGADSWHAVAVDIERQQYVALEVRGDRVRVSAPPAPEVRLTARLGTSGVRRDSPNLLRFSVKNEGTVEFLGYYSLRLMRGAGDTEVTSRDKLLTFSAMHVLPGEEQVKEVLVELGSGFGVTHLELRYMPDSEVASGEFETFIPSRVAACFPLTLLPAMEFTDSRQPSCRVLSYTDRLDAGDAMRLSVEVTNAGDRGLSSRLGVFVGGVGVGAPRLLESKDYLLLPGQVDTLHFARERVLKAGDYVALLGVYSRADRRYNQVEEAGELPFRVESSFGELPVKPYQYPPDWDNPSLAGGVGVLAGLQLDPNPAADRAVLRMRGGVLALDWARLHSLSGQVVWSVGAVEGPCLEIGVGHLPAGVYVLRVGRGGDARSLRLVVSR